MTEPHRAMSLRITEEQHTGLAWVGKVEGKPISAVIREAIDDYIQRRKIDPEFQRRLEQHRAETQAIYDRLRPRRD